MSTAVMDPIVEKIRKLIRLAVNNNRDHEANSAARMAARLIQENELIILTKDEYANLQRPGKSNNLNSTDIYDMFRGMGIHVEYGGRRAGKTSPPPPRWSESRYKDPEVEQDDPFKVIMRQCVVCMTAYNYTVMRQFNNCCTSCRDWLLKTPSKESRTQFVMHFGSVTGRISEHVAELFEVGAPCAVCTGRIVSGNLVVRWQKMVAQRGCIS